MFTVFTAAWRNSIAERVAFRTGRFRHFRARRENGRWRVCLFVFFGVCAVLGLWGFGFSRREGCLLKVRSDLAVLGLFFIQVQLASNSTLCKSNSMFFE